MLEQNELKLDFKDVLIVPKTSQIKSRNDVVLNTSLKFSNTSFTWDGIPIMAANMDTIGTFEMALELYKHKIFTCIHKHYSVTDWLNFYSNPNVDNNIFNYIAITCGITEKDLSLLSEIIYKLPQINFISLDVANGYTEDFMNTVKHIRQKYPTKIIIAGTVVTPEITKDLILNGANIVRIGIGGGSVCTTRKKTGVGYPQLSAILECADAAHQVNGYIVSDGGCTCPGDFGKAFGAGADFVMVGGLLSGHKESGGNLIEKDGQMFKQFYGMASQTAMDKYNNGKSNYKTDEGKTVLIPYKGPVENTILDILGGIRSTCTYVGAKHLYELHSKTTFIRVSQQLNNFFN
jgi:GMP reductase